MNMYVPFEETLLLPLSVIVHWPVLPPSYAGGLKGERSEETDRSPYRIIVSGTASRLTVRPKYLYSPSCSKMM